MNNKKSLTKNDREIIKQALLYCVDQLISSSYEICVFDDITEEEQEKVINAILAKL